MSSLETWVESAARRLPGYFKIDPLLLAAGFAVPLFLLDTTILPGDDKKSIRVALPVIGAVVGYLLCQFLRGAFTPAKSEPVGLITKWESLRKAGKLPEVPALEAAAQAWQTVCASGDATATRAAETGMLAIAAARAKDQPDEARETALQALAAGTGDPAAVAMPQVDRFVPAKA